MAVMVVCVGVNMDHTVAVASHKFKQAFDSNDKLPLCTTSGACARCARSPSTAR